MSLLERPENHFHSPESALWAASTAKSTSAFDPGVISAMSSSVAGLIILWTCEESDGEKNLPERKIEFIKSMTRN